MLCRTRALTYDTWALAHGPALALQRAKKDTWFFVTSRLRFGHSLEKDAADVVKAQVRKIFGTVRHPTAPRLLVVPDAGAVEARAKIFALANAVGDTVNS